MRQILNVCFLKRSVGLLTNRPLLLTSDSSQSIDIMLHYTLAPDTGTVYCYDQIHSEFV